MGWAPITRGRPSVRSAQALTEPAPNSAADGIALGGISALVPVLHAPQGQTFLGGGVLRGWYWAEQLGLWIRAPRIDDSLEDAAGLSDVALPAILIAQQNGRFALNAEGVTLSGGAVVTIELIATDRLGYLG